ncbi:MAG: phospho-N-acetylmuramoyl-pentapeptide-transferase, partial [Bacilli bacterium]
SSLAVVSCASMLGFGLLGFLDDYIKIKYKQNLGLNVWQKIVGQVGLSFIISFFAYSNQFIGSVIDIPFVNNSIDLGGFAIPFYMFIYLCITNSVNLTDGLDGLASGVSLIYLLFLGIIINFTYVNLVNDGASLIMQNEYLNLMFVAFAGVGALLAYLVINCFPAKIFMGDVGSLGLGGLIGTLTIFSNQIFIMPILGICFVWSALSVIIQVIHFKKTKKRVFLMAPFHHHLEMKGVHENRIVFIYITITASIGSLIVCFL